MEKVALPERVNDESDLQTALERVQRAGKWTGYELSAQERDQILSLYTAYDECSGAPDNAFENSEFPDALVSAIKASFKKTQERGALKHIRAKALASVIRCPICGIGPPRELDHYLPKSKYAVFSVYVRNLVPICHDCNNAKGDRISTVPARRFIHAFFDELPESHLKVGVSIENGGLFTEFGIPDFEDDKSELQKRLVFQHEKLKLNDRWAPEVIFYITTHETGLIDAASADGPAGVAKYLSRQAAKEERRFHKSHWRPVLLRALAGNQEFCDGGFKDVLALENEELEAPELV